MNSSELTISVGKLLGVPKVTIGGRMERWHDEAVCAIFGAFSDYSSTAVVVDIENLQYGGPDAMAAFLRALRLAPPGTCLHIAAPPSVASVLQQAGLGPAVRLYSSTNEIAANLSPEMEILTSRWVARKEEDEELPFAA